MRLLNISKGRSDSATQYSLRSLSDHSFYIEMERISKVRCLCFFNQWHQRSPIQMFLKEHFSAKIPCPNWQRQNQLHSSNCDFGEKKKKKKDKLRSLCILSFVPEIIVSIFLPQKETFGKQHIHKYLQKCITGNEEKGEPVSKMS